MGKTPLYCHNLPCFSLITTWTLAAYNSPKPEAQSEWGGCPKTVLRQTVTITYFYLLLPNCIFVFNFLGTSLALKRQPRDGVEFLLFAFRRYVHYMHPCLYIIMFIVYILVYTSLCSLYASLFTHHYVYYIHPCLYIIMFIICILAICRKLYFIVFFYQLVFTTFIN